MGVKDLLDLTGRIAIVTGGSRGIGLQMAEALGEMGAKVALTARKQDELDEARVPARGRRRRMPDDRGRPRRISLRSPASSTRCSRGGDRSTSW